MTGIRILRRWFEVAETLNHQPEDPEVKPSTPPQRFDRLEPRQFVVWQHHLDRPGLAGDTVDQTSPLELDDHLVHRGWRDLEEPLEIGLSGWSSVQ